RVVVGDVVAVEAEVEVVQEARPERVVVLEAEEVRLEELLPAAEGDKGVGVARRAARDARVVAVSEAEGEVLSLREYRVNLEGRVVHPRRRRGRGQVVAEDAGAVRRGEEAE